MRTIDAYKEQLERHAESLNKLMNIALNDIDPCKFVNEEDFVSKMCDGVINYFLFEIGARKGKNKQLPKDLLKDILLEMFDEKLREFYQSKDCE
jgi:hypothetical protein